MSYARMGSSGHYIYHDDTTNEFIFNCYHTVSDDEMAVFLYKIFLTRPEEFKQWVNKGRDIVFEWLNKSDNKEEKEYRQCELFFKYFNSIQNNTNEKLKDAKIKSLVFNPEFYNALLKNKYINKNNSTFMGYPFTIDYSKNADFWGMFMEK